MPRCRDQGSSQTEQLMQRSEKMGQWGTGRARAGQGPEWRGHDADTQSPAMFGLLVSAPAGSAW